LLKFKHAEPFDRLATRQTNKQTEKETDRQIDRQLRKQQEQQLSQPDSTGIQAIFSRPYFLPSRLLHRPKFCWRW